MKYSILLFIISLNTVFFAQLKIQFKDVFDKSTIPFVKVKPDVGNPVLADLDGFVTISDKASLLKIQVANYTDSTIYLIPNVTEYFLVPLSKDLEEVTVQPGVNLAIRIMDNAIENRKLNHPMSGKPFSCEAYNKFVFTIDESSLDSIPDDTKDTSLMNIKKIFKQQHIFLLESTTAKSFDPPYRQKEVITAYKVSGLTSPMLSTFASEVQSFHFYDNNFTIYGKSYLSPLAFGSTRRYNFILEDQIINQSDTTFIIRFYPKKEKNFEGMKGTLFINSNGFALEKVNVQPVVSDATLPPPAIIQEYEWTNNERWFPKKLSIEIPFSKFSLSGDGKFNTPLLGKGTTYIQNVNLHPDFSKERFNSVETQVNDDANDKDSSHWLNKRTYQLDEKEKRTYVMIDSLSAAENLNQKFSVLTDLLAGKYVWNYIQFDLRRLFGYKIYEGYRFGLGIENSPKLMKKVVLGGYFAYGTKDKQWKYGAYSKIKLDKYATNAIHLSFIDDIVSRGSFTSQLNNESSLASNLIEQLYITQMDRVRRANLGFARYMTPRLRVYLGGSYQHLRLLSGYDFTLNSIQYDDNKPFKSLELNAEFVWLPGTKMMQIGEQRIPSGKRGPVISGYFRNGFKYSNWSDANFWTSGLTLSHGVRMRAAGFLNYRISAFTGSSAIPLTYLQTNNGSGGNWSLSIPNTFETMRANSIFSSTTAAFIARYTTKSLKLKTKKSAPQLGVHFATAFGELRDMNQHNLVLTQLNKGYSEVGILLNRLLLSNSSGFGIGIFSPVGQPMVGPIEKNLFFKLSLSSAFDVQ